MIDANFIALGPFSFVFHRHRRASLFFAPNQDAFDAGKDRHRRLSRSNIKSLGRVAQMGLTGKKKVPKLGEMC